ncbi:MAG: HNH endonuclease signature motif containing protein, partial [Mycobacterium sp.]
RTASLAQRLMLLAKHRGCTMPGCTASAYRSQVHHANADWKDGGETNIEDLTLACGPDNRMVDTTGWTTRNRDDGVTEWIPPSELDCGQSRINNYHHPERILAPDDP